MTDTETEEFLSCPAQDGQLGSLPGSGLMLPAKPTRDLRTPALRTQIFFPAAGSGGAGLGSALHPCTTARMSISLVWLSQVGSEAPK